MGTIRERKRGDGSTAYMAQIIKKAEGRIIARKAATLNTRKAAEQWIKKTEKLLEDPSSFIEKKRNRATVGDAIRAVAELRKRPLGRTQTQLKRSILDMQIASRPTTVLDSVDIVNFARDLSKTRGPATVASYVSFVTEALRTAKALGFTIDIREIESARHALAKLGLTGASLNRDRRPTLEELDMLMEHFAEQSAHDPYIIPMHRVTAFAIFSTRRQAEITELRWTDLDEGDVNRPTRWTIHQMKDPKNKATNTVHVVVPPRALAIAKAMPASETGPFPYKPNSVSSRFTDTCKLLGIEGLTFHDLRHEAISHLFELRQGIPEVATVSGHKSWQTLQRYAHINNFHDKYADWKWLDVVTKAHRA
ncbi:site-specific integrase [Ahrensia kielensis]|uniref:Site-specific integrase n=1 Tax=Ahrensia kielensis TaxID=76980 RepID=A0ABU9T514_9HYPH